MSDVTTGPVSSPAPARAPAEPGLPAHPRLTGRQRAIMVVLLGTQFMLAIDFSILNVALPSIGAGLHIGNGQLQWVATAFALPAAGFTLLFGRVGDIVGRRPLLLAGLVLLTAASLAGGLASDPATLLAARAGQGVAAAIAAPSALSLLVLSFPEGPLRNRALGLNGALLSAGFIVGALAGGLLTQFLNWRWALLVNAPIALVIFLAVPRVVTVRHQPARTQLDLPGAVTVTGGLLALVFGITSGGNEGWGRPWVIAAIAAGVVLLAAFWQVESRSAHPLAPLHVLRRRTVGWGNFGGFAVFAMESSVVFLLTLYLQDVLGYSSLVTGLVFAAPGAAAVASGVLAPRLMGRYGSRVSLVAGLTLMAMSTLAMTQIGLGRADAIWVMVAAAVGFFAHVHGIVAYITTVTGGLPDSAQGLATGLTTMTQLVAITVGTPVFATIATARSAAPASTAGTAVATLDGLRLALAVDGIATLVITAVIALALLRRGPRDEARAGAGA